MLSGRDTMSGRERKRAEETHRTCAVTRAERPIAELVRFVAGPDDVVVPDLAARLPGRGVWVTATHDQVAAAVKTRAFAKSLKKPVEVPADLADRVEALMMRRLGETLSLANKAGQVLTGFTKIEAALGSGSVIAVFHGTDASPDGCEKLDRRFQAVQRDLERPAPILACLTIEQMSLALGRANVVHAALDEGGAARRVLIEAERLLRYRSRSLPSATTASATTSANNSPDGRDG